ncbi:hypothetical protein C8R34_10122 [Nitrosomonas sp. Nm84]|uniref:hypothetical protein n=1 Tax=Nitrosomonas sp. Nm84 TaxID=200124 RepID=UPI000D76C74D|nr:hypothetical protein [Nitrosomonas sp. Nm84]PXW91113.1 hypothetical protein C8R34_10122 [Nitrosomonas sp. Nm84]
MNDHPFTWPGHHPDEPTHRLIIAYLTIDIQRSPEDASELSQKISAVHSGQLPEWERIGNAYCLRLFPDYVEIEEDFAEEGGKPEKIPLTTFKMAVQSWLEHIAGQQNK